MTRTEAIGVVVLWLMSLDTEALTEFARDARGWIAQIEGPTLRIVPVEGGAS